MPQENLAAAAAEIWQEWAAAGRPLTLPPDSIKDEVSDGPFWDAVERLHLARRLSKSDE